MSTLLQMVDPIQSTPPSSLVFKRKAVWDGIRLEHCKLQQGTLPPHSHREHTVLISLSDGAKGELITSSGSGMKGSQVKGNIAVLPSGLAHQATLDGPSEHLAIYVEPTLIARAAADSRMTACFEILEKYTRYDAVISNIGYGLLGELNSEGLSGRLYAESLGNLLAVHLLRHYANQDIQPLRHLGGLSGTKLRHVNDFILEHYSHDIKLEQLAQVAGMSSFHFAREFKRTTGVTPHQYLIKFRVEQAKSFLANEDLSLIEVSLRSGFSHQSHFTRLFRKLTGTTPQLYRQQLQA